MAIARLPHWTPHDRLALALLLAVVAHGAIILGIGFTFVDNPGSIDKPTLDITLANQPSEEAPEEADYLAQANQEGAGNTEERVRATAPPPAPKSQPSPGEAEQTQPPAADEPAEAEPQRLTQDQPAPQQTSPQTEARAPEAPTPSAADLVQRSRETAKLSAEVDDAFRAYSQQPRHRYISARTKAYRDAAYLEQWRSKVERIGNLNYPNAAKQRNVSGSLLLDVAIRADGSVQNIEVRRSSGHKVLDDAAIRIVRLAAPFAPLPESIRQDTDILHIVRTWQFTSSANQLDTGL